MKTNHIIYLIAFLEGFTTLAVEVLCIRKIVPLIGNNIVVTSIILGIIILALSLGYYVGGILSAKSSKYKIVIILRNNLIFSAVFYGFISFMFENSFLQYLINNLGNYIVSIFVMTILLFFVPVLVASQTVPLLAELFENDHKGKSAGSILFYSTVGSFFGSIVPVLYLLPNFGINRTIFIIVLFLVVCALIVQYLMIKKNNILILGLFIIVLTFSIKDFAYGLDEFTYESKYQSIKIHTINFNGNPTKILSLDESLSSGIDLQTGKSPFNYIKEAILLTKQVEAKNILVIGAAGFTYPNEIAQLDFVENVDVVDIDESLFDIAQNHFLKATISSKVHFYPESGRYFINQSIKNNKKYDLVFIDVYSGKMNIPNEFLTKEYFESVSKIGNIIISNLILDPKFNSQFSSNLLSTIRLTGTQIYYKNVTGSDLYKYANFIFSSYKFDGYETISQKDGNIYYDNMNNLEIDKFKFFY